MIGRRKIIGGVFGLLGLGAVGYGGSLAACAITDRRQALIRPLFPALSPLYAHKALGQAWLQVETADDIFEALTSHDGLMQATLLPGTLSQDSLSEVIRQDFQRGELVEIDRWVVTKSEARIAAAKTLLA